MAKRASKKGRDVPPLYVVVQAGKLAPAFQLDQERILSFRNDTRLVVTIETDGSRRGVRRWHAIIGKAVKNSLLPWVTVGAADEAIRLALDLYEPKKANDGSWHRVTQSLNDLTDEELDEQIELMSALIYRISGVDPDEFRKELAGAGDERFQSDYDKPAADNENAGAAEPVASSGSATNSSLPDEPPPEALIRQVPADDHPSTPQPVVGGEPNSEGDLDIGNSAGAPDDSGSAVSTPDAAAPNSAEDGSPQGASDDSSGVGSSLTRSGTAAPEPEFSAEDREWLKVGARMLLACQPEPSAEAKTVLFNQVKAILNLMPKNASNEARGKMEAVKQHCLAVCRGEVDLDVPLVARTALATVAEITPGPVKIWRKA